MFYFKILESFLLRTLFSQGEYNITSKNFNPLKLVLIFILLANVGFTVYLMNRMAHIYELIKHSCPTILYR